MQQRNLQPEGVGSAVRASRGKDQPWRLRQHGKLCRQRNTVFAWQIDVDQDRVRTQLGAKTQAGLGLCGRIDDLYLTAIVQELRQVLGGQGLIFDNNRSDPDPDKKNLSQTPVRGVPSS